MSVEPRLLHGLLFRMENGVPRRLMTGWGEVAGSGVMFRKSAIGSPSKALEEQR